MTKKSLLGWSFFTFAVLVFTLSYYSNFWRIVKENEFEKFDFFCQSQVVGRVLEAQQKGIFSDGGLTGWVRDDSVMKNMDWKDMTDFQFVMYENNVTIGPSHFIIYDSMIGGQAILYAIVDKISPFRNTVNLKIFWLLTSIALAVMMSAFLFWCKKNFGLLTSIISGILILISYYLTFYGRNLYYVLPSSYLPFIVLLILLMYESERHSEISLMRLCLWSVLVVFIKLFLTGFEYITSTLVMFSVPLFYYFILNDWSIKFFIKRLLSIITGTTGAVIIYTILYSYQLYTIKGSFLVGFENLIYSFLKRTHGNSANFPEGFKQSLDAGTFDVIKSYYKSIIIDLGFFKITFQMILFTVIIISAIIIISNRIRLIAFLKDKKRISLIITTWISILAPLSWFVVFKAHAFIHHGFDEMVLYMPFCMFAYVLAGDFVVGLLTKLMESRKFFKLFKNVG